MSYFLRHVFFILTYEKSNCYRSWLWRNGFCYRLRKKGYKVEIVDRCNNLGGRAQVFNVNGFRHDAGPTLITAPFCLKNYSNYIIKI